MVCNIVTKFSVQSTPALRTPRYYLHLAITDKREIPGWNYKEIYENSSRYNGYSLLLTYGHFAWSQSKIFIVFLSL